MPVDLGLDYINNKYSPKPNIALDKLNTWVKKIYIQRIKV